MRWAKQRPKRVEVDQVELVKVEVDQAAFVQVEVGHADGIKC